MELVTDRTEADVIGKKEKGIYGYTDLNRVESAVAEIASLFPALGISLTINTKTDWGIPGVFSVVEWPTETQMQRYLGNIAILKRVFSVSAPIPNTMSRLTWVDANNIEKALQLVKARADSTIQTFRYSGEFFAGEE